MQASFQNCESQILQAETEEIAGQNWQALRADWLSTIEAYHRFEPFLWDINFANGDRNFNREDIYSWPSTTTCEIDQQVLNLSKDFENFSLPGQDKLKGLDALEYLLYSEYVHACNNNEDLDNWNALPLQERLYHRCEMASLIADELILSISRETELFNEMRQVEPADWVIQKLYESFVIFVDRRLKDRKVGTVSANHHETCPSPPFASCPYTSEHRLSQLGYEALVWNYEGLRMGFLSKGAYAKPTATEGLYGMLNTKGFKSLAQEILNEIETGRDQASQHVGSFMQTLAEQQTRETCAESTLENQTAPLCTSFQISKRISDLYKVDLRAALLLENTRPVEGDGD